MRNAWIIASVVVAVAVILAIGLSVGFLYKNRKVKSDTVTNEIIWSFHLENDSDLKINGNLDDVINVYILKKEGYSVGGNNASVNSFTHDFPTTKLTGWTHSYQIPLRIRKFIVGSNEVGFLKITPISGFAVFNNQDLGDFVTIWHDDDFHHYSKSGELISVGAFPFANGDKSIHPKGLKIPTRISEDANLDFNGVVEIPSGHDDKSNIEVTEEPEPKGVTVDTKNEFDTDIQLNELVEEPIEPEIASVSFNPLHGLPSGHDDKSNIEVTEGPEPEGVTVDTKNEFDTDIQLNELVEEPIEPEIASVSFNPLHGLPSGHDDKSNIEVTEGPEPEGVTVDTKNEFDTDIQLNELVEEPIEPEIASVSFNPLHGLPSGHDDKSNIEVTEGPEPEGVTVDTKNEFDTDIQLNELVEEPIEPEIASVSFNPLHGFPSGWHDRDVVEEPKPLLNGLYPDLLTTGWARDDLDIDPEPEPLLNGLYPDLLTTGWARDDLDIDPEPEPLLNGLYPDTLRTGWALDDLDKSKKRKTVYTDFDPSIGFPSGWHDRDIVEKPIEPGIESVSFNPVHGFPSGWHDRDIVEKPIEPGIESVSFNPVHGFPSGWHDRDIVEKQIEQDIESVSFNPVHEFPSEWHDNSDIVYVPEPILNGLYPDTIRTGFALDDLVHEERPPVNNLYPDVVTTGCPAYELEVEPDPKPILNGLYPDTIRTGFALDDLVHEERPPVNNLYPDVVTTGCPAYELEVEPDPKPILNGLYPDTIRTGFALDDLVHEERPPVNNLYPDVVTTGCPAYELEVEPDPKPILNGLYPDTIRTGFALDDLVHEERPPVNNLYPDVVTTGCPAYELEVEPDPKPILNGLYPDTIRTGFALDDLVHEERPPVNNLYPDVVTTGCPAYELEVEPDPKPILNGLYPDTIRTGFALDDLVHEERPPVNNLYPDVVTTGCPAYELEVEPDPKPILNGLYPDTIRTGFALDDLVHEERPPVNNLYPDVVTTGCPAYELEVEPDPKPILNGLYPDTIRTGFALDDLVHEERPPVNNLYPDVVTTGCPAYELEVEPDPKPILNGLYPDTIRTGFALDDLVHEERPPVNNLYPDVVTTGCPAYELEVEPDPKPILNGLYPDTIRTGFALDDLVHEERPPVNNLYPDVVTTGCPAYELEVEPDPKPILNGLYPDTIRTGFALDDLVHEERPPVNNLYPDVVTTGCPAYELEVEPDPKPILNGLYPDTIRTGFALDDLVHEERPPVNNLYPDVVTTGCPAYELEVEPDPKPILNGLYPDTIRTGFALDDLVHEERPPVNNLYPDVVTTGCPAYELEVEPDPKPILNGLYPDTIRTGFALDDLVHEERPPVNNLYPDVVTTGCPAYELEVEPDPKPILNGLYPDTIRTGFALDDLVHEERPPVNNLYPDVVTTGCPAYELEVEPDPKPILNGLYPDTIRTGFALDDLVHEERPPVNNLYPDVVTTGCPAYELEVEPDPKPILNGLYPDTIRTGFALDDLVHEERPPVNNLYPDVVTTGCPAYELEVEPDPKPILNGLYPDTIRTGFAVDELDKSKKRKTVYTDFDPSIGFPSGWHDNSDIVYVPEPILNGLYPDVLTTGWALDDLVNEERPVVVNNNYPDVVTTGCPAYELEVEPDPKPILNGLYPDTIRTGFALDDLVHEERPPVNNLYPDVVTTGCPAYELEVEPDPKPILNGLYPDTIRTGFALDDLVHEERPPVNNLYPDVVTTGCPAYELEVEPDPKPILNGLYPDTIRTGFALDDLVHEERPPVNNLYPDVVTTGCPAYELEVEPDPKPILNGLYPDTIRTGFALDDLVHEERPPVNNLYPDVVTTGCPAYELEVEPDPKPILNGLYPDTIRTGFALDDLVHEERPPVNNLYPDVVTTGCPAYELEVEPDPKPILNGLYPDTIRTGFALDDLVHEERPPVNNLYPDVVTTGCPAYELEVEPDPKPILNGLYPDTIRTGFALDDLVHEERPPVNNLYPDVVTTGCPAYELEVEPDPKPILNGLYPDTIRTGFALDDLVHEERPPVNNLYPDVVTTGCPAYELEVEPDPKPILNGLYPDTIRTGFALDDLVHEERPPVNNLYPDVVTTGCPAYELEVEPDPKPILNGLYPDTIRTGFALDDLVHEERPPVNNLYPDVVTTGCPAYELEVEPDPKPILNGLYPDTIRTGFAVDELDKSKKRKTVYTDFDPSIGFPSGWHDNSDIVYVPEPILNGLYPDVLTTGWALDDLVNEERPVVVNNNYPDVVTTGCPAYELEVEPDPKPILNGLYPDTIRTGFALDDLVHEERPPVNNLYPDVVTTGCPAYELEVEPDPKPILNGLYPDTIRTGFAVDELDKSKKRKTVYTDFDPSIGFPSGWHDNSDIVYVPEPILNGLYPDVLTTGWALDDLVNEERPVVVNNLYPDVVTTGCPAYELEVEPDPKPILNGLYPDTIRTGFALDDLVHEERPPVNNLYPDVVTTGCPAYELEVEPDPKPILNGLYPDTIRTGFALDDLVHEERPPVNNLYPDVVTTGCPAYELEVEPDPKPILNGLYPDTIRTGFALDDLVHEERPPVNNLYPDVVTTGCPAYELEVEPDPKPILNGLYPDTIRTGFALDDLVHEERPPVNNLYPDVLTTGWALDDLVYEERPVLVNNNYPDVVTTGCPAYELEVEPDPNPILNGLYPDVLRSGWARDDLDVDQLVTFVNILPEMNLGNKDLIFDFSVITLATETSPYIILQGDDEMIIKKRRIDDVFKKYICTLTNERSFRPQIRYLLSNFQLEVDDISEFELFVGEYDEPLLIRMKNSSGWNTYVHSGDNKWEAPYVPYLDINVLDKYYLSLRDDITTIDFSKTSGNYKFGKYRIEVTEPEKNDIYKHQGFKTYIHTIYHDTDYSIDFASVKVHRFKYDNIALKGFIRYHRIGKLYVYFWEHELTKPIYIRACADHGFANYFGYPNYVMQTDVYMFPYYLKVTNFEVNDALVINLARHEKYDFEGGVSPHLTRHQITVTLHDNSPIEPFRSYVHTLTVGGVNKPFSILRFLNEVDLNVDPTKVSSVEAYYHNKHLKKPLMFILNGSSKQTFYKLENDSYVKMDNLFSNLEITLKYLAYHNYNYVSIDVSKSSTYHYTGAAIISSLPDSNMLVSVVKEELNEFSKLTHSIKVQNKQSKFKLMALNGVDISFDDPELTSVDCYFFNEQMVTPLAFVLRGTNDLVYVNRKDQYVRKTIGNLDQSLDTLRRLVQYNLGIVYLRLDLKSNYYNNQDDGFNIEVSRGDKTHDGYTHYVHKFPSHKDARFLNGNDYFNPKVEPGEYEKADVFFESNKFPSIVSLTDTKGECYHFIFQNGAYKKAKAESVDKKLSSDSQTEPQEEPQSETHTPLLKPSIKPIQEQEQTHTPLLKPSLSTTPQVSPPPVPESPASQLITPSQTETHTPLLKPSVKPIQEHSPKLDQTPPPLPKGPPSIATSQPEPQPEPQTKLIRPSLAQLAKPPETPPPLPKGPPSIAVSQPEPQPEPQTKLIKLSLGQSQTETQPETQTQTKLIKPLATSQPEPQTQTKLIRPLSTSQTQSQPEAEKQSQTPPPLPKLPPSLSQ